MNNDPGFVVGMIFSAAAFSLARILYALIENHLEGKRLDALMKEMPSAIPYKFGCDIHTWTPEEVTLVMNGLEVKDYKVCTKCGYIAGTELRLNKAGKESLKEKLEFKAKKAQAIKEGKEKLSQQIDEVKNNFIKSNSLNNCLEINEVTLRIKRVLGLLD